MIYFIYPDVDIWEYMVEGIYEEDVVCKPLNPSCYKWQIVLRKLFNSGELPSWCLFGKEMIRDLKALKPGDTVLISDYTDLCLFKAINNVVDQSVRKCLWIWNPVKVHDRDRMVGVYKAIEKTGFEISTFDEGDAERYGQKLYSQFFRMKQDLNNIKEEYDFYFIGFEKNRGTIIKELQELLKNYRCCFKVIHDVSECIPYAQNIENIKKAKCVIEIVQDGQEGITLRPLEAISCGKKLLTNNKNIKKYDFYSPQSVFILGEDHLERLDDFINSARFQISDEVQKKINLSTWLNHYRNRICQ